MVALPPMALAKAFDALDLAWLLVAKEHLVRVPRVSLAARLSQPAASGEEFESRCGALADLLSYANVPAQEGEKGKDPAEPQDASRRIARGTGSAHSPHPTSSATSWRCGQDSNIPAPLPRKPPARP